MEISIIIPYRDNFSRRKQFAFVVAWWKKILPEAEIIASEDRAEIFHKTRAVNEGVKRAQGSILIIADADMIVSREQIRKAINEIRVGCGWAFPFNIYKALSGNGTSRLLMDWKSRGKVDFGNYPVKLKLLDPPAGIIVINLYRFRQCGGYDERFKGWGFEDRAFYVAASNIIGPPVRIPGVAWHLWHVQDKRKSRQCGRYKKNILLKKEYYAAIHAGTIGQYVKERRG